MSSTPTRFLTAEWRWLLMANYEIAPEILQPYLPAGVELDPFQGRNYVSMVGFRFLNTRVLGIPIPFHRNFDEINLRFYVRRRVEDGWRRGVVFIKEIVPRWMISGVACALYQENYVARRMRSRVAIPGPECHGLVEYEWQEQLRWNRLTATFSGEPVLCLPESEESYITEHYWGYTRQRNGGTAEFQVEHPPWRVWGARSFEFDCDIRGAYGEVFVPVLSASPHSAFVAEGSAIGVRWGKRIA